MKDLLTYINIEPLKMATGVANSHYIESQFLQIKSSRKKHLNQNIGLLFLFKIHHTKQYTKLKKLPKSVSLFQAAWLLCICSVCVLINNRLSLKIQIFMFFIEKKQYLFYFLKTNLLLVFFYCYTSFQ